LQIEYISHDGGDVFTERDILAAFFNDRIEVQVLHNKPSILNKKVYNIHEIIRFWNDTIKGIVI